MTNKPWQEIREEFKKFMFLQNEVDITAKQINFIFDNFILSTVIPQVREEMVKEVVKCLPNTGWEEMPDHYCPENNCEEFIVTEVSQHYKKNFINNLKQKKLI